MKKILNPVKYFLSFALVLLTVFCVSSLVAFAGEPEPEPEPGKGGGGTPPAPTVTSSWSPQTVELGTPQTYSWSSTDADSCVSANGTPRSTSGSINQTKATVGSETSTITCTGPGGSKSSSASRNVTPTTNPAIATSPSTLTFGDVEQGKSKSLNFSVRNTGTGSVTGRIGSPGQFQCSGGACGGFSIPEGGSVSATIVFTPDRVDDFLQNVTVVCNECSNASVQVTGRGVVALGNPMLVLMSRGGFWDFGATTRIYQAIIRNGGDTEVSYSTSGNGDFQCHSNCSGTLAIGQERTVYIERNPFSCLFNSGSISGTITITGSYLAISPAYNNPITFGVSGACGGGGGGGGGGGTNGVCGSSDGGTFASMPASNRCTTGTYSGTDTSGADGAFNWNCAGSGGGATAYCSATNSSVPPPPPSATIPTVINPTNTNVTETTATLGARISSNGGSCITARGTCWSTTDTTPSLGQNCSTGGTATGVFTHNRTGLPAGTTIYYRGYATNGVGTGYSAGASFTTSVSVPNTAPSANAGSDRNIVTPTNSATPNGASANDSDGTIASTVWSKVSGPSGGNITNGTTLNPTFNGMNTVGTYVFRLTVTDNDGATDTDDMRVVVSASAPVSVPTVINPTNTSVTDTTATLGATVSSDGGSAVTARGTCWATSPNPTTNCSSAGGTGVGSPFTHNRTGLPAGTTVYYRGYADNANGRGYSVDGSFVTSAAPQPNLTSQNLSYTGTVQEGQTINLTARARNNGAAGTGSGFSDRFEYRYGGAAGDYSGFAGNTIKTEANGALGASSNNSDSASYTIPVGTAGQELFILHCVDVNNNVPEADESVSDNCSLPMSLNSVAVAPVDLEISKPPLVVNETTASIVNNGIDGTYNNVPVRFTINNLGTGPLPANSSVPYKAIVDGTKESALDLFNDALAAAPVPASKSGTKTLRVDNIMFGDHNACARVNLDGSTYPESPTNLANNEKCTDFTLPVPEPPMDISADDQFLRSGEATVVRWNVHTAYNLSCNVSGPGINSNFDASANHPSAVSTQSNTPVLSSTSEYVLTCTAPAGETFPDGSTTIRRTQTIEVIPDYEEQ